MEERQISQRQIATYLHITEQAVSGKFHQRSKFSANQILALADFFEVSVDYLMGRSDTPWPDPWKDKEG